MQCALIFTLRFVLFSAWQQSGDASQEPARPHAHRRPALASHILRREGVKAHLNAVGGSADVSRPAALRAASALEERALSIEASMELRQVAKRAGESRDRWLLRAKRHEEQEQYQSSSSASLLTRAAAISPYSHRFKGCWCSKVGTSPLPNPQSRKVPASMRAHAEDMITCSKLDDKAICVKNSVCTWLPRHPQHRKTWPHCVVKEQIPYQMNVKGCGWAASLFKSSIDPCQKVQPPCAGSVDEASGDNSSGDSTSASCLEEEWENPDTCTMEKTCVQAHHPREDSSSTAAPPVLPESYKKCVLAGEKSIPQCLIDALPDTCAMKQIMRCHLPTEDECNANADTCIFAEQLTCSKDAAEKKCQPNLEAIAGLWEGDAGEYLKHAASCLKQPTCQYADMDSYIVYFLDIIIALTFACVYKSKVVDRVPELQQAADLTTLKTSLFQCFEAKHRSVCLHSVFCPAARNAHTAAVAGVCPFWLGWCFTFFTTCSPFEWIVLFIMRSQLRKKMGMETDTGGDILASCFCSPCAVAQMAIELDQRVGVEVECCCKLVQTTDDQPVVGDPAKLPEEAVVSSAPAEVAQSPSPAPAETAREEAAPAEEAPAETAPVDTTPAEATPAEAASITPNDAAPVEPAPDAVGAAAAAEPAPAPTPQS